MSKKMYVTGRLHKHPIVAVKCPSTGEPSPCQLTLPPGCVGILFVFGTKKAARAWEGKDVSFTQIEASDATETS